MSGMSTPSRRGGKQDRGEGGEGAMESALMVESVSAGNQAAP